MKRSPDFVFLNISKIHVGYLPFRSVRTEKYFLKVLACLVIFFDFLQSDWLQQRAAFYDILTVVQKCYILANGQE